MNEMERILTHYIWWKCEIAKIIFISLPIDIFQTRWIIVISDVVPDQHLWMFHDSYAIDMTKIKFFLAKT